MWRKLPTGMLKGLFTSHPRETFGTHMCEVSAAWRFRSKPRFGAGGECDRFAISPSPETHAPPWVYLTSFANTTNGVLPLLFFTLPRSSSSSSRTSWMKPSSSRVLRTWEMNRAYLR